MDGEFSWKPDAPVKVDSQNEKSAYKATQSVVQQIVKPFQFLHNASFIDGLQIALYGSSATSFTPPSDIDILIITGDVDESRKPKSEAMSPAELRASSWITFINTLESPALFDFPIKEISDFREFPKGVDIHLVTKAYFLEEVSKSKEKIERDSIKQFDRLAKSQQIEASFEQRKTLIRIYELLDDAGSRYNHRNVTLVNQARDLYRNLLEADGIKEIATTRRLKYAWSDYERGSNFYKNLITQGAVLLSGENPIIDGKRLFIREDKLFLPPFIPIEP